MLAASSGGEASHQILETVNRRVQSNSDTKIPFLLGDDSYVKTIPYIETNKMIWPTFNFPTSLVPALKLWSTSKTLSLSAMYRACEDARMINGSSTVLF